MLKSFGTGLAVVAVVVLAILIISVPLDLTSQWLFAGATIVGTILLNRIDDRRTTLVIAILSVIISTRYMVWRTTHTLEFQSVPEFVLGAGLYLAEAYAWVILLLGVLQTGWPLHRPIVQIEGGTATWPLVDIYVPTYNESLDIVRNTVFAAQDMDYPADRFRVYILDDGRRPEFRAFARLAGCGYLTRADNLHAKAGNLNAAMKKTDGELIAIFDCDHVPTRAFLQLTVGWFQKDPKLALLQTPHHFYSSDPVQRNLNPVRDMPGEGELFYNAVQSGNDLWNATFFCGSCAIIRRTALSQTNGFAGETVTEDAHTALKLQRMGWNTAYINIRLSAGLATERLILHIGQRIRWARGMTQIFRIDNPLLGRGLNWQQRLCYLNAMLHFQFPLPRIVFLTSPLAYLLAGQNIIHASASLIFAYALPHLFVSMASSTRIQGGDRRPFWGEIYETLLAFHLVRPTLYTLINPHKGKFNVTDKGSLLDKNYFDFQTVRPHLITLGLLAAGIVLAVGKSFFPQTFGVHYDTLLLNTAWAGFSMLILLAAIAVARERRQIRSDIRIEVDMPVSIYFTDGYVADGRTVDVSMGGLSVKLPVGTAVHERGISDISLPMGDETLTLPAAMIRMDGLLGRIIFQPLETEQLRQLVRAVMGRSDAWQPAHAHEAVSGLRSVRDIAIVAAATLRAIFRYMFGWRRRPRAAAAKIAGPAVAAAAVFAMCLGGQSSPVRAQPAGAVAAGPTAAIPAAAAAPTAATHSLRLSLKDLQVRSPIRLAGTRGEFGIPFGMRRDGVVTAATLTLNFAYSPAMLGDLSQLVVMLNGEVVRTLQLQPDGAGGQQVAIPVNPALFLVGDNSLNIRLVGHYTRDCEDSFSSALWANVSNVRSFLDLTIQPLSMKPELGRLPAPFFDRYSPGPLNLPFVFAGSPTNGEMEASATLASWFGAQASYRRFTFRPYFNQLPKGDAVVFMTRSRPIAGLPAEVTGSSVAVMVNPADPSGQLLVIMGRDDRELKQAAAALATERGLFAGQKVSTADARIPSYGAYGARRWLRTDRPVKLGELVNPNTLQGIGLPPGPLTTAFRSAPDLFFWPSQGGTLNLRYRYPGAPWLSKEASRLDVSINGQYLRTLGFAGAPWWNRWIGATETATTTSQANVLIPNYNLFGQNELTFDYNLALANQKRCTSVLPENVRTSILPDSTIDLTNTHHAARMPDLATFAGAGYPFTIYPDLAQTAVLVQPNAGPDVVETFLEIMGRFGDSTGVPASAVTVTRTADGEQLDGKDILVIGTVDIARGGPLFAEAPLRFADGRFQVTQRTLLQRAFYSVSPYERNPASAVNGFLYSTATFTGITSFESPFSPSRTVVAVLATDPVTLPQMIAGFSEVKVNAQVQGDLSVVVGDGMSSFAVGDGYWVGALPMWLSTAYWLSQHPLLMALGGLFLAVLLSYPMFRLLKRQERKRLQAAER
ncbi:UDP-forming cellulose synthase catalytic subunit [Glacieibacterium sp.]|uniref:UDP-forming cellulose synthase catalytic subunit n=1 Tax=Glacieibacterium sp. TaxID=2860237 RepID=UPI003B002367